MRVKSKPLTERLEWSDRCAFFKRGRDTRTTYVCTNCIKPICRHHFRCTFSDVLKSCNLLKIFKIKYFYVLLLSVIQIQIYYWKSFRVCKTDLVTPGLMNCALAFMLVVVHRELEHSNTCESTTGSFVARPSLSSTLVVNTCRRAFCCVFTFWQ